MKILRRNQQNELLDFICEPLQVPYNTDRTISPSVGSSCCSLLHHKDFLSFREWKLAHLAHYRHQDEVSRYGYVKHGCYHGCYHVPNSLCSDHG